MRRIRFDHPTFWHVISRGVRRLQVFRGPQDYARFLEMLAESFDAAGVELAAYALLENHYHLLARATTESLGQAMRRLQHRYALRFNRKNDLSGHAFEGPYRAHVVKSEPALLRTARYIHLNPVAAGLARRAEDYTWTNYALFAGEGRGQPGDPTPVLTLLDRNRARAAAQYRAYVQEGARTLGPAEGETPDTAMHAWVCQARWILQERQKQGGATRRARAAAAREAHQSGIPPRAIQKAMGFSAPSNLYNLLARNPASATPV